eukprot:CAMPEP_0177660012 /NCGR_PEP_ID=MMETSP0447-20121125/17771_1 /TAXON_ID=0 /ORGANISM="Stygamoeba regulata, Strain BSH-02190019" /LENGTH=363 /DNA_ID=CAMNT_0019164965 /DNA_START=23 /DNA_END=1114 /DNA_ORIENTATION=-
MTSHSSPPTTSVCPVSLQWWRRQENNEHSDGDATSGDSPAWLRHSVRHCIETENEHRRLSVVEIFSLSPSSSRASSASTSSASSSSSLNGLLEKLSDQTEITVFFVHGAGGRSEQFIEQAKALIVDATARGLCVRVLLYDHLGHGHSAKPLHDPHLYSTDALVSDLRHMLSRFGSARNAIVAHSYGTSLTLSTLASHPDLASAVHALLLLAPSQQPPPGVSHPIWYLPAFALEWVRPLMQRPFQEGAFAAHTREQLPLLVAHEGEAGARNPMYMMRSLMRGMQWATESEVRTVRQPALILCGAEDAITSAAQGSALVEWIPNARAEVLEHSSHVLMLEQRERVNELLLDHLAVHVYRVEQKQA